MRRHAAPIVLVASHVLVVALALVYDRCARPTVLDAFVRYGTEIPLLTAVALAPWLVRGAVAAEIALALAALAPLRRSRRIALLAAGLCVGAFALVFAVLAAFAPLFSPA